MKTLIIAAAISATLTIPAASTPNPTVLDVSSLYAKSAVVVALDSDKDIATVQDANGFTWNFCGCEDYEINDVVDMVMWDNGTADTILDDVIVSVRYSGYISADFQ